MFGRKKDQETAAATKGAEDVPERDGAKNRPTPKRRDQEAARKRPLVQSGGGKSTRKADKEARRENARKMREAMVTGDEKHLPPRDKGPVRRFARDAVDVRFNFGELLLPLMLAVLILSLFAGTWATYVFLGVYVLIIVAVVDAFMLWRATKKRILERFGKDTQLRGLGMYQGMRAFQMRRTRMPKPMVKRGGTPR